MAPDSKPKKPGLWSKFRRSLSSSLPGAQDDKAIAQDLQGLALHGTFKELTPPSLESHVPVIKAENIPSPIEPSTSTLMFSGARHFNVENIHIEASQHVHHMRNGQDRYIDGWEILLDNIASNAFYDSAARSDPPKCDEDTRVEVIGEVMDWINNRDDPKRLLCMTGAAGAGKSALVQTIAERCSDSGILGCAFFFLSEDPSRNDLTHIVPTIAFQLGQHDPTLQDYIRKAIEKDRLIFSKTVRTQMETLVVRPFQRLRANGNWDPSRFPYIILIDGLDECSGEENQVELLSSIKHCLLDSDLPFRMFLASRPEWAIRNALGSEPPGYLYHSTYYIPLSDKYDATNDIRRYLWRKFRDIGSRSRDHRAKSPSWPRKQDVEKLVIAASGQFVYAATVVKYVSERHSSPVDRLQTVVDWTPEKSQLARPFETLDILYARILSTARELYEAVDTNRGRNLLLLLRAHQINLEFRVCPLRFNAHRMDQLLDLNRGGHDALVSDLHSLVVFLPDPWIYPGDGPEHSPIMHFYHRSFSEFLESEIRSKNLFVPRIQVITHVVDAVVQGIKRTSLEPSRTRTASGSTYVGHALVALALYSNKGEALSTEQVLSLSHHDAWRKFDDALTTDDFAMFHAPKVSEMMPMIMQRLTHELKEPRLADALGYYHDKLIKFIEDMRKEDPNYWPEDLSDSEDGSDSEEKEERHQEESDT